jgi:hypothetical protein
MAACCTIWMLTVLNRRWKQKISIWTIAAVWRVDRGMAERISSALPMENLHIDLGWVADEQRSLIFTPNGTRYKTLLEEFRRLTFGG